MLLAGDKCFYMPSGALRMAPGGVFVVRRGNYTPGGESGAKGQGRGMGNGEWGMDNGQLRIENGELRMESGGIEN